MYNLFQIGKKKGKSSSLSSFSVLYDCLLFKKNNPKANKATNMTVDITIATITPVEIVLSSGGGGDVEG